MQLNLRSRAGFTLVELLIVVTIIGILAVAVLAAINPIEQFNKTRDTGHKTDAGQLVNAIERYYTNNDRYPWSSTTSKANVQEAASIIVRGTTSTGSGTGFESSVAQMFAQLVTQGELKQSFVDKYMLKQLSEFEYMYIVKAANSSEINVCFQPQSKAMRSTEAVKYPGAIPTTGLVTTLSTTMAALTVAEKTCDAATFECFVCMPEIVK